jgi:elongation factor 1-beta
MMATVVIIVKLLPESPDTNLDEIKELAKKGLEPHGAKNISFEEKPIAFGLKALMLKTDMPEEKGTDLVESILSNIPNVSSVTIEDYRRAFG